MAGPSHRESTSSSRETALSEGPTMTSDSGRGVAMRAAVGSPVRPRALLAGALLGAGGAAALWVLRDAAVLARSPLLVPVSVGIACLAFFGYRASLLAFTLSGWAATVFLHATGGRPLLSDPVERQRFVLTSIVYLVVGGLVALLRVDRQRLVAREREHRESEERYRTLLDQASDAIFVSDESGRLVIVNARAAEMTGFAPAELLGRNIRDLISPESLRAQPLRVRELRDQPLVLAEREMVRKDGTRFVVEVSARLMTDGRTQAIARDITERRREESSMRALEAQLQHSQRLEAVGRLAGSVAHDFNNVLTVILGNADLLASGLPEGPDAERAREVRDAAARAAALTRQLLAFSRKQPMQLRPVDANSVVREFEKMMRRAVGDHATLSLQLGPGAGTLVADAVQLEQVLLNLVVNARDAVAPGGRIDVSTRRERAVPPEDGEPGASPREFVVLTVRDDGAGMDAETQAQMFEPFFTTKPVGRGTGLGLSTVFGIVRQSGGFLRVQSTQGRGTSIDVLLPAHSPAPPPPQVAPERPERGVVLLIEDEEPIRNVVRRLLSGLDLAVLDAASGDEMLRRSASLAAPPALLVTDVTLPGTSGREVADALVQRWPGLPVLYLSGYVNPELHAELTTTSGRVFLPKPFTWDQLIRAVERLVAPAMTPGRSR